jgi:hypothetical protein
MPRPTYRVRVRSRRRRVHLTAPFAEFGDANRWAIGYCRVGNCSAVVVASTGIESAAYRGDAEGRVWPVEVN